MCCCRLSYLVNRLPNKKVYRFLGFTHHKTKKKNWTISWKKLTFFVFFGCCDHLLAVILVKMWTYSKTFIYHLKGHNTIYKCYKYQRDIDFSSKDIIHWIWKNTIFAIFCFFFSFFSCLDHFRAIIPVKIWTFLKPFIFHRKGHNTINKL